MASPPLFDKARILRDAPHRSIDDTAAQGEAMWLVTRWGRLALVPGHLSQPLEMSLAPILDDSDCR